MLIKEEYAIILDFLSHGYPFDQRPLHRKTPIVQAIGKDHFILLELVPKKDQRLQSLQEVYMGEGKRDHVHHIIGRIPLNKLTQTALLHLQTVILELIKKNENKFVDFFNKAGPINTRRHQMELIPGIGKKHMWDIIEQRQEKPFASLDDIKSRVKLLPDLNSSIKKRILMELNDEDKYKLFVGT